MRIEFEHVKIHGFLSIGDANVNLNNQGVVMVSGHNDAPGSATSNGSGKSTIFESIFYVLTGKTLRGSTDVVNIYLSGKEKYAEIELSMNVDNDEYVIKRTREHPEFGNNLFITKNGKDISGDKLKKSETILANELPKVDTNLLGSVIILGQGLPNKFTSLTPQRRKERLEELAETSVFVQKLQNDIKSGTQDVDLKMTEYKIDEGSTNKSIEINTNQISKKTNELSDRLSAEEVSTMKKELQVKSDQLSTLEKTRDDLTSKYHEINQKHSAINTEYNNAINYVNRIQNDGNNAYNRKVELANSKVCPTCGRPYDDPSTLEHIDQEVRKMDDQINSLLTELSNARDKSLIITDKLQKVTQEENDINDKLNSLPKSFELMNRITDLKSKLSENDAIQGSLTQEIDELKLSLAHDEKHLTEISKNLASSQGVRNALDYLKKISAKEFRSYLLQSIIMYLNGRVQYYGESLFGTNSLELDLDEGNGRLYVKYEGRQYESLSGGERQKADLSVQFSLRDMLMYNLGFSCNLLVLDESFDNLDTAGTESLIKLITGMSDIETVEVVSHHASIPLPYDNVLNVYKSLENITSVESGS